jgi:hypothetical protein
MRLSIGRHLVGTGAVAVVVVALCGGWLVYDSVAQDDGAAKDGVLTVGQCIDASAASVDQVEKALIQEGIIGEGLLQTKVTNGMCKDMRRERIPDGTPVRRLVAAQSYIQEIELVEGAMREAVGEAAARETDHYSSNDESFALFRAIAQTSERVAARDQYQAVVAASVGEDADAPIPERYREKVAAAKEEGASAPEAAAGAQCSLQVEVTDEGVKDSSGMYDIRPELPEEMVHKDTKQADLLVFPLTKERLQEIRQQEYKDIAEASGSEKGCVVLTDRMKATLLGVDLNTRERQDDIQELSSNRHTIWRWFIFAHQAGKQQLSLLLSYDISGSREDPEFRLMPKDRALYDRPVWVTLRQSDSRVPLWRVVIGVVVTTAVIASVTLFLLWRRNIQGHRSD